MRSPSPRSRSAPADRPPLPGELRRQVDHWAKLDDRHPEIRRANRATQLKLLLLHLAFVACLAAHVSTGGHPLTSVLSVLVLGLFVLPFVRVFMHSQAHWRIGNGAIRNWLLDRTVSLLFSIPQTGYRLGHLAHHRYDNDHDPRGYPRDLQSTYLFSRDGRPCNIWVWCFFYLAVYQHAIHLLHVLNSPRRRYLLWYVGEQLLVVGLHLALLRFQPTFYLQVYLPSLALAWIVAALALYMMHALPADAPVRHPTLTSLDPLLNWFGDNDGYHLEHTLFAGVHPVFLARAHQLLAPPPQNVLHGNYVLAALPLLLRGPGERDRSGAAVTEPAAGGR